MTDATDQEDTAAKWLEERLRDVVRRTAVQFRRVAEDLDRIAEHEKDLLKIPGDVTNVIMWGVANARIDSPAVILREYIMNQDMERKKAEEATS